MASITTPSGFIIDMSVMNFYGLLQPDEIHKSATTYRLIDYAYGKKFEFRAEGSGFKYDSKSVPTAGEVKSIALFVDGKKVADVADLSLKATDMVKVARTSDLADDTTLWKKLLSGNDTIKGAEAGDTLLGYAGSDKLYGNAGKDTIDGGSGNDTIYGGAGSDKLKGGSGADKFVFNAKLGSSNVDQISDFTHNSDLILLDDTYFGAIGSSLSSSEFYSKAGATTAHDSTDHIIYNPSTGRLYYDKDSKGGADAVHFATLTNKPKLDAGDFDIV